MNDATFDYSPIVLVVLDGWGISNEERHNGIAIAKTPNYDAYKRQYSSTTLSAAGEYVGLPKDQIGNSEVGHSIIGAGRILDQPLVKIRKNLEQTELQNAAFLKAFQHVRIHNSMLHFIGLFSHGGVHSHEDHLYLLLKHAIAAGIQKIVLHLFLDGRDVSPSAAVASLKRLEFFLNTHSQVLIGSICGRYFGMDRDTNWDRTQKSFDAIAESKAEYVFQQNELPSDIIQSFYDKGIYDEHIEPLVWKYDHMPTGINKHDGIIFFNFRSDRTKQLSQKIQQFIGPLDIVYVTMTAYEKVDAVNVAFPDAAVPDTLGSVLSDNGISQARIAETEKYAHVTYFFNGGNTNPKRGEEHVLIPSRKDIRTHDEAPQMKAKEITDAAIARLDKKDFLFINYANVDMVGHSANETAIIEAIENVDREIGRLTQNVLTKQGTVLIVADHGNAELMVDPLTGGPHTAHTTNPVPCLLIHNTFHPKLKKNGSLQDIAPTVLELFGISKPDSMTGTSLILHDHTL